MTIPYIQPNERNDSRAYQYSRHSGSPRCMNLILDFVEAEFGLLPVETPGWSLGFLPPFAALVGTALWDTSVWVSLHGKPHQFDGNDTVAGQNPNWRKFHVTNSDIDITRVRNLMRQACSNYRKDQAHLGWDEIITISEERWEENRRRELRKVEVRRLYESL